MPPYWHYYSGFGWKQFLTFLIRHFGSSRFLVSFATGFAFIESSQGQAMSSSASIEKVSKLDWIHDLDVSNEDKNDKIDIREADSDVSDVQSDSESCQKLFPTKTRVILPVQWHVIPQKNPHTLLDRWLKGFSHIPTFDWDISNQS